MATRRSPSTDAAQRLRDALSLALRDLGAGRAELRDAEARFAGAGDEPQRLVAAAAQVLFIGIADDDYTGFEAAVRVVVTLCARGAARSARRLGPRLASW